MGNREKRLQIPSPLLFNSLAILSVLGGYISISIGAGIAGDMARLSPLTALLSLFATIISSTVAIVSGLAWMYVGRMTKLIKVASP